MGRSMQAQEKATAAIIKDKEAKRRNILVGVFMIYLRAKNLQALYLYP